MASPFGIRFFTTGYSKTISEMSSVEKRAKSISTGFIRMGEAVGVSGPKAVMAFKVLGTGVSIAKSGMKAFLGLTLRVTKALGILGTVVVGVGAALATKFSKGLMTTRETFYLIETALTGVVKNAAQVRKISEWAMQYAAQYPATFTDVMHAMKGLAMMPALKPMFTKASVADMEKIMNILQSLAALDPMQGIKGARLAIREALAGEWRSLRFRFELRPQDIAAAGGFEMEEIRHDPEKAIQALDAFVKLNVGANTLRKSAESLAVQWGNLSDKYKMWLNQVAQYGAYRKLVTFLMTINDVWDKLLKSDAAKRLGQDISRVFDTAIDGLEKAITGIDWEKAGIFGGILEAGKAIIDKVSIYFTDAKEILKASLELALIYMAKALEFSVKNIFYPIGVAIGKGILAGLTGVLKERLSKGIQEEWVEPVKKFDFTYGRGKVPKDAKPPYYKVLQKRWFGADTEPIEKSAFMHEGPIDIKELMPGEKPAETPAPKKEKDRTIFETVDTATTTAEKALSSKISALWSKIESGLGPKKDIEKITVVEEQMKKVVEARVNLRVAELTGTKAMVESAKSQFAYEERLLQLHKKTAAWEADPKTGKREAVLKVETRELRVEIAKEAGVGKTFEELEAKVEELAKKQAELDKLTIQREKTIGDVKRYTNIELEKISVATLKKQSDLKIKLLNIEKQIAKLKKVGGEDRSKLPELERTLLDLAKEKLKVEQKFTNAKKQQLNIQNKIQMMEMMKGGPDRIGISTLERSKGMFLTFKDWIEKEQKAVSGGAQIIEWSKKLDMGVPWSPARGPGQAKMPGMMGMTWREAVTKSTEVETKGIPRFFLKMEEVLREKLGRPDVSLPAQKSLLERLYGLNVEQFQMATGKAKGVQFLEANKFMMKLMSVETKLQEEQIQLAREQAKNIASMVVEMKTANRWLSGINGNIGNVGVAVSQTRQSITPSDVGNNKITHSNPNTTTYEAGGMLWEVMNR